MTEMSPSAAVASRVKEVRRRRGWSVRELAERCAEVGATGLTANALENIERDRSKAGRRGRDVTVDELFALAYVLDLAPSELLVPSSYDVDAVYRVTPNHTDEMDIVRAWLDMRVPLGDVHRLWERMKRDDGFADELRRVWFAEQTAHKDRVDLVRRVRAELSEDQEVGEQ